MFCVRGASRALRANHENPPRPGIGLTADWSLRERQRTRASSASAAPAASTPPGFPQRSGTRKSHERSRKTCRTQGLGKRLSSVGVKRMVRSRQAVLSCFARSAREARLGSTRHGESRFFLLNPRAVFTQATSSRSACGNATCGMFQHFRIAPESVCVLSRHWTGLRRVV